ncbi:ABC transporter substrate-binding protein [Mergibacter septicus]|uniref:ABC transporter substrate-binding protein n=1 Tax=Mergibacter septicus TaxID=221402 RepID=UPI0011797438|nr:ABC transporter substrate-binding protein [Mergibacter septicus]AWX13114.1 ABC transporter substrate-binding protein [Mergibacter septicus]
MSFIYNGVCLQSFIYRFCLLISALYGISTSVYAIQTPPKELRENSLVYCARSASLIPNWQKADASLGINIINQQIYNRLFEQKTNNQLIPSLAKSYSLSADGKTLLIKLKRGIKFHHTPWFTPTRNLNADDVVFSLNHLLGKNTALPELNEPLNTTLPHSQLAIFNANAKKAFIPYFDSLKLAKKIISIRAVNPYLVEIKLTSPDASMLSHLAGQYAAILSYEYALQLAADDNLAQLYTKPIGTGAYLVKNHTRDHHIRLVRNPDFWGEASKIKNIVLDISSTRSGWLTKFLNHECDILALPDPGQVELIKQQPNIQIQSIDDTNLAFLALNTERPFMLNSQNRQAIALAINRSRLIRQIYYNAAKVANGLIPQISLTSQMQTTSFAFDYEPKKAGEMLKSIRSILTKPLIMWVVDEDRVYNPNPVKMAEMIKFDLSQVGVPVKIKIITRNFLNQQIRSGKSDYDMILTGWQANSLDPDGFLRPILSCQTRHSLANLSNWCDPQFDNFIVQGLQTDDTLARALNYDLAQQLAMQQVPIIPLANASRVIIARQTIKGLNLTPFGNVDFSMLYFDRGNL